jgi:hypothetical protein
MRFIGFQSCDLFEFTQTLMSVHSISTHFELLPLLGLTSTLDSFAVIYEDPEIRPLDPSKLTPVMKDAVLRSVTRCLVALHSAGFAHFRLKPMSVFCDAEHASFYLGCLTPRLIVNLDPDDEQLPFYQQPSQQCDTFHLAFLSSQFSTV